MAADCDIYRAHTDGPRRREEEMFCVQDNLPAAQEIAAAVADGADRIGGTDPSWQPRSDEQGQEKGGPYSAVADERARTGVFRVLYRAAESDISRAGVRECADLRYSSIRLQGIRLARPGDLSPDLVAGDQDSAVYDRPAGAVAGSQRGPDH